MGSSMWFLCDFWPLLAIVSAILVYPFYDKCGVPLVVLVTFCIVAAFHLRFVGALPATPVEMVK